jgi:hypothetical protein
MVLSPWRDDIGVKVPSGEVLSGLFVAEHSLQIGEFDSDSRFPISTAHTECPTLPTEDEMEEHRRLTVETWQ